MKTILDSSFKYKPSFDSDIRKTFDRVRRAQRAAQDIARDCSPWFDASAFEAPVMMARAPLRKVG